MKTSDEVLQELNEIADGWELTYCFDGSQYNPDTENAFLYVYNNKKLMVKMTYWGKDQTYLAEHREIVIDDRRNMSSNICNSAEEAYFGLIWNIRFKVKELLDIVNLMNGERNNGNFSKY